MATNDVSRPQAFRSLGSRASASLLDLTIVCWLLLAYPAMAWAELRKLSYYSRLHGSEITIHVYTPPAYETGGLRYPVIYHLQGRQGAPERLARDAARILELAVRRGEVKPLILVFARVPAGPFSSVQPASGCAQAPQSVVQELLPFVDATYRTIASREGRAIEGFGEAACAALRLAFEHPYLFAAAAAYGPSMPRVAGPSEEPNDWDQPKELLHPASLWKLAESNYEAIREYTAVRLIAGDGDAESLRSALRFKEHCEKFKIPLTWHAVPGVGCDFRRLYARAGAETLRWMQSRLQSPTTGHEGLVQDVWYWSEIHRRYIWVKVYTPPGYETSKRHYPVVYNLHGGGGTPERQWQRTAAVVRKAFSSGAVEPMIYVFVNGLGDTFFMDLPDGVRRAETTIVRELIPFIEQRYRAIASHQARAIDGFSMGGAGALRLALKYPELFSAVVSYGAALVRGDRFREQPSPLFSPEFFDEHSAWTLAVENAERVRKRLRIRMVCGDQDRLYPLNVEFRALLEKLGISVDWVSVPGVGHDTRGLYRRVGMESLIFIQQSFAQP